jgi:ABC-type branched-subunit amino acid transport system ATPase component
MSGLVIEDITKRFGGVLALDGVSFTVERGTVVGLIGPNGSGKSTLLNVISGYMKPEHGELSWLGRPLRGKPQRRGGSRGIVRTFQNSPLLGAETVRENLLFAGQGLRSKGFRAEALSLFRPDRTTGGLNERVKVVAERFELTPWLDVGLGECSCGVRNLIAMATAAMADDADDEGRLFLLDEPFAGIEEGLGSRIASQITDLREHGATVLLVDHRMDFIRSLCSEVVVLAEGQMLARGETAKVLSQSDVRTTYLGELVA